MLKYNETFENQAAQFNINKGMFAYNENGYINHFIIDLYTHYKEFNKVNLADVITLKRQYNLL